MREVPGLSLVSQKTEKRKEKGESAREKGEEREEKRNWLGFPEPKLMSTGIGAS